MHHSSFADSFATICLPSKTFTGLSGSCYDPFPSCSGLVIVTSVPIFVAAILVTPIPIPILITLIPVAVHILVPGRITAVAVGPITTVMISITAVPFFLEAFHFMDQLSSGC